MLAVCACGALALSKWMTNFSLPLVLANILAVIARAIVTIVVLFESNLSSFTPLLCTPDTHRSDRSIPALVLHMFTCLTKLKLNNVR